ncbi:sensor histidine kinase [Hymenobacter guriensis]|uniref:Sensor histidine kinase n=1 Tax=Hymenobacter guriensis TaxID=2793065 RepID=A0ABS0L6A0_9BACT|nr:sensor histidine kinase [Hymenobacter guriensis]MBG8554882.1 sensor histidine kinase [Hymenobacter guriensis]
MKDKFIYWHILGWLAYAGYELLGVFVQQKSWSHISLILMLSFLLFRLIEFYLCYLVVYPRLLRPGRTGLLATALAGVVALFIGMRYGVEEVLFPAVLGFHNYGGETTIGYYLFDNAYFASPMIVLSAALWAGRTALRHERENQLLRAEKRIAEVAFLKTQINPHFLYNTLNMLYSMAYPAAKPVANAILKLSELMRYMLHDTPGEQVGLDQEIDYLSNYLDLYRLRFPGSFHVNFTVTGNPAGRRVAPLVLIPFVENALKHGVLDDPENPVHIWLDVSGKQLLFEVENQRSTDHKDVSTGIGLPNLRRRLKLLYPERHALHVGAADGRFRTALQLVW